MDQTYSTMTTKAMQISPKEVNPELVKKAWLTPKEVREIIEKFASYYGISDILALTTTFILLGKGIANEGTPLTYELTVQDKAGTKTGVSKKGLLDAYSNVTNNKYLIRLAETMYENVAKYNEKHR